MLVAVLVSLGIALPLAVGFCSLIWRGYERLPPMHERHPTDHDPYRNP